MARGVNKVIIIGHLGNDPDVKYTQSGSTITTISVATTEAWKDKQTGQQQERTEWHRVKFFGRLAEIAGEYLKKGKQVYVEGSLRTDKYTGKDGIERYTTDIIANEMKMLGGGEDRGQGGDQDRQQPQRQAGGGGQRTSGGGARRAPPQQPSSTGGGGGFDEGGFSDDDIPF